jgi:dihydroflavonol-4-reductase
MAADGWRLRCLVRNRTRAADLATLGAELIDGDATDEAAMLRGMHGVDLAVHLAGIYDIGVVDREALARVNVHGARVFLRALEAGAAPRGIHVSSTVALGPSAGGSADFERRWAGPYPSVYHRTKTEAHWLAREAQRRGAPLAIVCPTFVYGPGDAGPPGRLIDDLIHGRVPGLLAEPAVMSYVFVDDVADTIATAAARAQPGAIYVIGGEPHTINHFAERVCALLGKRAPRLRFPVPLARLTGRALDGVSRVTGVRFSISREAIQATARECWHYEDERAAADLGHRPRPLDDGLPPTVDWFVREKGSR